MYEEHPLFIQPEDENVKVWRYMDFTKLVSLIDSSSLFFTRADKFEDPYEGAWPRLNKEARKCSIENVEMTEDLRKNIQKHEELQEKQWPKSNGINCWHMNEHESAAMWRLYLKSNEGVAVQSSFMRLKNSFICDEQIFLGKVKYIDYEKDSIFDANNLYSPLLHKRKSFKHEQEIRGVITKWPSKGNGELDFKLVTIENGVNVKVDLNILIENIFIAPDAPLWLVELANSVIVKYGYNFNVIQSNLNVGPLY